MNILCLNSAHWWEWDIKEKYNALIMDPIKGSKSMSVGFLIPKTMVSSFEDWTDDDRNRLFSRKKEFVFTKGVA